MQGLLMMCKNLFKFHMPLFRVFKEFSADFNRVKLKYFDIQTSYRFTARFFQFTLPIGIWSLLVTQAHDVQTHHANMVAFFNTIWAFSVILGPLSALLLTCLHRIPFFSDPLTSVQILMIEAVCDFLVMGSWTGLAAGTPFTLTADVLGCPENTTNTIVVVPVSNTTIENMNTTLNDTNTTIVLVPVFHTCVPHPRLWLNLTALFGTLACLFFLSLSMDVWSYLKGIYWDLEEHNEREHAATASTLRQLNKFGSTRMVQGEMASVAVRGPSRSGSYTNFGSVGSVSRSNSVQGGLGALKGTVR
jgi:hypothetical protein